MNIKFIKILLVVSLLSISTSLFSQAEYQRELPPNSGASINGQNAFAVTYTLSESAMVSSGAEINITYDKEKVSVISLDDCLKGIPKALTGDFTKCSNFEEQGIVQILIADLTRLSNLPKNVELGFVEFSSKSLDSNVSISKALLIPQDKSASSVNSPESIILEKINY